MCVEAVIPQTIGSLFVDVAASSPKVGPADPASPNLKVSRPNDVCAEVETRIPEPQSVETHIPKRGRLETRIPKLSHGETCIPGPQSFEVRIEFLELEVPRPASPNLEVPRPASLNLKCRNPSKALETPETAPAFHGVSINSWGEHISPVCSINSGVEHKSPGDEQNGFFSVHANHQPKPSARCAV